MTWQEGAVDARFRACEYEEIEPRIVAHNEGLASPIDSFAEEHVLEATAYAIDGSDETIGYCCVFQGKTLTQFALDPACRQLGQAIFAQARRLESVQESLIPTCDEVFLSYALDDCSTVAVQAYFFQHVRDVAEQTDKSISYRWATPEDLLLIRRRCDGFFDEGLKRQLLDGQISIGFAGEMPVAFGVFERGRILRECVSIGMYTVPAHRRTGVATSTLLHLIREARAAGLRPIAGCWVGNRASKRSLERAGMASGTRYLRIGF